MNARVPNQDSDSKSTSRQVELWISDARQGSTGALGQLADACRQYLLSIANAELTPDVKTKVGGSDLVQQTLLEACRDFARFHGEREAELLAWLRAILLHNLSNVERQFRDTEKRDIAREVSWGKLHDNGFAAAREAVARDMPVQEAILEEERQLLAAAVARLPQPLREVIELRRERNLTFAEIGLRMNRSEEAARKLWVRAIRWLQEALGSGHG